MSNCFLIVRILIELHQRIPLEYVRFMCSFNNIRGIALSYSHSVSTLKVLRQVEPKSPWQFLAVIHSIEISHILWQGRILALRGAVHGITLSTSSRRMRICLHHLSWLSWAESYIWHYCRRKRRPCDSAEWRNFFFFLFFFKPPVVKEENLRLVL